MVLTNDQYIALSKLEKWYRKYTHQIIEISGIIGTGVFDVVKEFLDNIGFDNHEILYLSYDQKQVVEMGANRYHTFFIDRFIYKYNRVVNFDSLPVLNSRSSHIEYIWEQTVRKKINPYYKIIIVFDSLLLNEKTLTDLCSFGLPIILMKDPLLLPANDSYLYTRDSNIKLRELHPDLMKNPLVYFANKIITDEKLVPGNYDKVSIIQRKQMNLYNLQYTNMIITMTEGMRKEVNKLYRRRILKLESNINIPGERLILYKNDYREEIVNEDEENIKIYLHKGLVGKISRCYKHREVTKYLNMDFQPDFYHKAFEELMLDRHFLNNIHYNSKQEIPDKVNYFQYAYALTPYAARINHWDSIIMTTEFNDLNDKELQRRLLYTGITRAKKNCLIII